MTGTRTPTNSRLLVVPGAGHAVMNEKGELMPAAREALAAWLTEQVKSVKAPNT